MAVESREAGQWVLEKEIGSGSFAKVWRATNKQTQQVAAVKEINLDKLSKKLQESLASEVAVLKHTQHHNIVCLVDLIKDANRLYLVLEFCAGGDLGHYLRRYRQVSEATARYFLQQVAEGLKELRRHNVIHRDLKPQNLLLSDGTSTPLLKIADFGFARSLAPQGLAETLCGSPLYMAPEILQFQKYDAKADLWSIGTILFELLVGKPPYNGANHIQLLRNIEASEARLPEHIANRLSPACRGLLGRLLQRNPVERITFEEFFTHPFLTGEGQQQGPIAGIPPAQPLAVAGTSSAGGAVPAAMRQAAAAAAAAAAADARLAQRAGTSSVAKPQLHLTSSVQRPQPTAQVAQAPAPVPPPQQQQQQAPAPPPPPHQQQQYLQQQHQQQLQQQQQYLAGLVSQPVSHHPLGPEPSQPSGADVEALSDSMEGDFVVVYTPQSSTPHTRSTSNSSSKASSGLADPKAAAVLQGTPGQIPLGTAYSGAPSAATRRPWQQQQESHVGVGTYQQPQHQQQQQQRQHMQYPVPQQLTYSAAGGLAQHQGLIQVSTGASGQYSSTPGHTPGYTAHMGGHSPGGVGGFAGLSAHGGMGPGGVTASAMQHSSLQLPATPLQRVQLLVQVVRGCVSLLASHDGGNGPRDAAGRPALQEAEQLALLLLALQIVQLLCCPDRSKGHQDLHQHQEQHGNSGGADVAGDLAAVLASASQSDVEQLMAAVVDLLKLAEVHTRALTEQQGSPTGHTTVRQAAASCQQGSTWGATGVAAGVTGGSAASAAASHMISSLMQVPLPDPAGVLYLAALDSCKAAAVEEVMGNWRAALDGYSLAADLLLFLGQQWPELPAPADPGLMVQEQAALHRLYVAVNGRLSAVVAEAPPSALTC